jgi:hypothetical protein
MIVYFSFCNAYQNNACHLMIIGAGPVWCTSLLPWHDELHPEEAGEEEGYQGEDKLRPV